jgi:beta-lactamase superfamily II metal-dependent hydrolase
MPKPWWAAVAVCAALAAGPAAAGAPARGLNVYFIDTEGGAATLIVTPAGESVLIDCGNPGRRDAERVHKVATERAGLGRIDHLVVTHWHVDHYGGVGRLAELMPVGRYYHHGIPDRLAEDPANFPLLIGTFRKASEGKAQLLRPGDTIPLRQAPDTPALSLTCLCGNGDVVPDRPGAPENPVARDHKPQPDDPSDNARSLGFLLRYGDFRFLDLGDLTWNVEYKLVHPSDKVGPVDVYQVTHHGLDISNNPVLLRTVSPRVAVFNNGPRKGGSPKVTADLRRLPDIQAIYQMHRNETVGPAENTDPDLIANGSSDCRGEPIHLAVAGDGKSYTVTVGGKGKPRRFETRTAAAGP